MAGGWRQYVVDKGFATSGATIIYRAVKRTANGASGPIVGPIAAVTDVPFGVAQEDVSAAEQARGKQLDVAMMGVAIVEAGAAVTAGQRLTIDSVGRAVPAVAASSILGLCVQDASGSGKLTSVLLALGSPVHP